MPATTASQFAREKVTINPVTIRPVAMNRRALFRQDMRRLTSSENARIAPMMRNAPNVFGLWNVPAARKVRAPILMMNVAGR